MSQLNPLLSLIINVPLRLVIGFFAGMVVCWFGMRFLGYFVVENVTTIRQEAMLERTKYWNVEFAVFSAIVAVFIGGCKVSIFWLWFVLAFGAICVLPVLPSNGGSLLPFGTPYVNDGPVFEKFVFLVVHSTVAVCIALVIHGWNNPGRRDRVIKCSTTTPNESPN